MKYSEEFTIFSCFWGLFEAVFSKPIKCTSLSNKIIVNHNCKDTLCCVVCCLQLVFSRLYQELCKYTIIVVTRCSSVFG